MIVLKPTKYNLLPEIVQDAWTKAHQKQISDRCRRISENMVKMAEAAERDEFLKNYIRCNINELSHEESIKVSEDIMRTMMIFGTSIVVTIYKEKK